MKMKRKVPVHFVVIILVMLYSCFPVKTMAQDTRSARQDEKKIAIKNMIDSQHFVFFAQTVSPLRGGIRQLTSEYDVQIDKNSLVSYLPYFGTAYAPPTNPAESDLSFNTNQISYSVLPFKKHGWTITIKPKNNNGVLQYIFTIFDNGTANLNVTSISRDAISFSGYIQQVQKKKNKDL
jgi:Domain of unknown function (DUF4251)